MRARKEFVVNKKIVGLLSLIAFVFCASIGWAQSLARLAPPVPAVHRSPTPAQALCDRMARYAASYPNVPLGVRTLRRSADFNPRDLLQAVALRRWAEQDIVENGGMQPAAHTQAQHMSIVTIVARLREVWNVPADRRLRFTWSLAFERETWCDATTIHGREPVASQAVSGSLQASFCIVPTGDSYRLPHECGLLTFASGSLPEIVDVTTGQSVDMTATDTFGYGGIGGGLPESGSGASPVFGLQSR